MGDAASCVCNTDRQQSVKAMDAVPSNFTSERSTTGRPGELEYSKDRAPRPTPRSARLFPDETPQVRTARASLLKTVRDDKATEESIEKAFEEALEAGVPDTELAQMRDQALRTARRRAARAALAAAMAAREEQALREALSLADDAAIDHCEVEEAVALIEKLEQDCIEANDDAARRSLAVARLEAALKQRSRKPLEDAIAFAESVHLASKAQRTLLSEARITLKLIDGRCRKAQERRARERE